MTIYTSLRATAQRLIQKNGRTVTHRQPSTTLLDAANPQLGTLGDTETSLKAAFILNAITNQTQQLVQQGNKVCLIAADDFPSTVKPKTSDIIVDKNKNWVIVAATPIDPSDAAIVYEIILRA